MAFFRRNKSVPELANEIAKQVAANQRNLTVYSPPSGSTDLVPASNLAQLGINDIDRILASAPHLRDGEKASFSMMTSRTKAAGTETHTLTVQLEPKSTLIISLRKRT